MYRRVSMKYRYSTQKIPVQHPKWSIATSQMNISIYEHIYPPILF